MYNEKLLRELEKLKERFRIDIDEHDNYNLMTDTISEIQYVNDEIKQVEEDFVHDMDMIEEGYQSEIDSLEDEVYELKEEVKKLKKDLKNTWHSIPFDI